MTYILSNVHALCSKLIPKIGLISINILHKLDSMKAKFIEREISDFTFSDKWLGGTMLCIGLVNI
jgi:hypothetical protein